MANLIIKYSLLGFPIASTGLGFWQLKRLEWKKKLVANLEDKMKEEPIDLLEISSAKDIESLEYRQVKTHGRYDSDPTHQLFLKPRALIVNEEAIYRGKTAHQSNNGVNVITPFTVDGTNLRILVNRGWLGLRGKEEVTENAHIGLDASEPHELVGVIRKSDKRSTYGLKNDVTRNEWHIRDIDAMAQALNTAPIFIDANQDTKRTQGPIGGQTQLNIRNEHLNYAITWFGLAAFSFLMWYSKYGKIGIGSRTKRKKIG